METVSSFSAWSLFLFLDTYVYYYEGDLSFSAKMMVTQHYKSLSNKVFAIMIILRITVVTLYFNPPI